MIRPWKTSSTPTTRDIADRFRRVALMLCAATPFGGLVHVHAQRPTPSQGIDLPALSHYVASDTQIYAEFTRLPEVGSLRFPDMNLPQLLLELLDGERGEWRSALLGSLGTGSHIALAQLFRERVAFAAPDWARLGDGVIILSQSSPRTPQLLVGPGKVVSGERVGRVRVFRTKAGLWVASSNNIVALGLKRGSGTHFDKTLGLLNDRPAGALADVAAFRERMAGLTSPHTACAFWNLDPGENVRPQWTHPLRHGALSIHIRGRHAELELIGAAGGSSNDGYRPRVVLDRIEALPQATLAAWATSFDPQEMFDVALRSTPPRRLQRLWNLVTESADADRFREDVVANIGPRCIVILGADMGASTLSPQLGVMVEAVDGAAVVASIHGFVEQLLNAAAGRNGDEAPPIRITQSMHLGTRIYELELAESTAKSTASTFASLLTDDMRPCFANVKGWVVVSTSPSHIRQMVDAGNGLWPRVGEMFTFDPRTPGLRRSTSAAVVQPSLALGMLRYWQDKLIEQLRSAGGRTRLGISVHTTAEPGSVIIADVHTNGPSAGLLEPDDAVIACNGHLLRMDAANDHLKALLAHAPANGEVVLRVLRDGRLHEVSIPPEPAGGEAERTGIAALLERLAPVEPVLRHLLVAVYSVQRPSNGHHHSRLVFEFDRPGEKPETTVSAEVGSR